MKVKLWIKLAVVFLLVAVFTIALVGGIVNIALNRQFADYVKNNEEAKNQRIVNSLTSIYKEQGSWQNIRGQLMHLEMMTGRRVKIIKNGENVFDSRNCKPGEMTGRGMMGRNMRQKDMMKMKGGFDKKDSSSAAPQQNSDEMVKIPIKVDSKVVGHAYITSLNQKGLWSKQDIVFRKTINSSIIIAGIIAGVVALLISFFISRRITYPIQKMTTVAQAMGEGDLAQRVEVNSKDEIGILGKQLNQLAAHLEKLEELREKLTADVAHELRTPLTTIQSYIEAFQDGVMSANQENLSSIYEEVIRLVELVNDLQELSITEGGKYDFEFELVDLKCFIQDSVRNLSQLFKEKDIDVKVDLPEEEIELECDKDSLNKIIHNVLSNAYKYTEKNGQVIVDVKRKNNKAIIKIKDDGIGIAKKELPYIFERFYRVDESRTRQTGGTGIGLAIVKELVEAHTGEIDVNSRLEEGTEFIISLPLRI